MFCPDSYASARSSRLSSIRRSQNRLSSKPNLCQQQKLLQQQQQQQQLQEEEYDEPEEEEEQQQLEPCFQQQDFNMGFLPMPAQECCNSCEPYPQQMGMCIVTEVPEGLSVDCNVPIPHSFNVDGCPNMLPFATPLFSNIGACQQQEEEPLPEDCPQPQFQTPWLCNTCENSSRGACHNLMPGTAAQDPANLCNMEQNRSSVQRCSATSNYNYPSSAIPALGNQPQAPCAYGMQAMTAPIPSQQLGQQPASSFCPSPMQWQQQQGQQLNLQLLQQQLQQQQQMQQQQQSMQPQIMTAPQDQQLMGLTIPCQLIELRTDNARPNQMPPTYVLQLLSPMPGSSYLQPQPDVQRALPRTSSPIRSTPVLPRTSIASTTIPQECATARSSIPSRKSSVQPLKKCDNYKRDSSIRHSNECANMNVSRISNIGGNGSCNVCGKGNGNVNNNGNGQAMHGHGNSWVCPRCSHWCWHSGQRLGAGWNHRF